MSTKRENTAHMAEIHGILIKIRPLITTSVVYVDTDSVVIFTTPLQMQTILTVATSLNIDSLPTTKLLSPVGKILKAKF